MSKTPADAAVSADAIWRELGGSIRAFVRRRIADPGRADDVVSEVLLRGLRSIHTLEDPQRITAWILQIARNTQAQAARLEGLSTSGMKSRVQRGRVKLTELLQRCCALTLDGRGLPLAYDRPHDCSCR